MSDPSVDLGWLLPSPSSPGPTDVKLQPAQVLPISSTCSVLFL